MLDGDSDYNVEVLDESTSANHIRVIARIRPMNEMEAKRGCHSCIHADMTSAVTEMLGQESENSEEGLDPSDHSSSSMQSFVNGSDCDERRIPPPSSISKSLLHRFSSSFRSSGGHSSGNHSANDLSNSIPEEDILDEGIILVNSPDAEVAKSQRQNSKTPLVSNRRLDLASTSSDHYYQNENIGLHEEMADKKDQKQRKVSIAVPKRLLVDTNSKTQRSFDFDAVLPSTSSQEHVYTVSGVQKSIRSVFKGFHSTVLAYGVTGAGKTYTMSGPKEAQALAGVSSVGNLPTSNRRKEVSLNDDDGVIARAIYDLFRVKQEYVNTGNKVNIRLSCLEIYQDELRDLLVDSDNLDQVSSGPAAPVSPLKLRDIGDAEGVVVRGLETISVHSIQQVKTLMNRALLRRTTAATSMNERSSRSHAVCTLTVTITPPSSGTTNATAKRNRKGSSTTVTAKLTLVDLAGSERIKQTGVVGVHKQESININKDLFVLGKVVSALAEKAKAGSKVVHVPYRDSKLTRLLRDSLGGNCSTVLIACVSPADNNVDDSVNTLRYAERSRTITNSLRQNVVRADRTMSPAECASIRAENQKLKAQVTLLQRRVMQMQRKMEPGAPKDGCSGMDSELSSLQAKLKLAEEEARAARANSRRVVETADRWREQCEVVKSQGEIDPQSTPRTRRIDSVVSPCLSYELSVGVSDVDSLIEDDDRSVLSLDTTTKEILSEDNAAQSKVEIEALKREKVLLRESLQEISDQIESKRAELKKVDLEFRERHAMFRDEVEREEKKRDELAEEVARMKIRLNLLASDVKEDGPGRNTFSSVIRGFIGEGAAEKEEVEMKIMKVSHPPPKKNDEADNQGMRLAQELAKTLGETKSRCDELETKCSTFGKELEKAKSKNKSLRDRNGSMQKEILRLHEELARAQRDSIKEDRVDRTLTILKESSQVNLENERADDTSEAAVEKGKPSGFAKSEGNVQSHVQELLRMASQAASKSDASLHSNCTTSITTDATSLLAEEAGFELETPTASDLPKSEEQFFISNIAEAGKCVCESSLLAQNSEHVEFYLPQIEYSCSCGKRSNVQEYESGDLYSLELILRPWQVEFLASIGITGAVDFVHAVKQRGGTIAQQMRRWRRQMGMLSVKTRSCLVALHIWQRTCKAVVRNVREQEARGVNRITKPHFLEVSRSSDNDTVSTLGYNSVCMNEPTQE